MPQHSTCLILFERLSEIVSQSSVGAKPEERSCQELATKYARHLPYRTYWRTPSAILQVTNFAAFSKQKWSGSLSKDSPSSTSVRSGICEGNERSDAILPQISFLTISQFNWHEVQNPEDVESEPERGIPPHDLPGGHRRETNPSGPSEQENCGIYIRPIPGLRF